jgi:hypothetical protein
VVNGLPGVAPKDEGGARAGDAAPWSVPLRYRWAGLMRKTISPAARNLLSRPAHRKRSERGSAAGSEGVWSFILKVNALSDPLNPTVSYDGKHDRYPSYEIIVIQSDGTYKDIHRFSPNVDELPGPTSLSDGNAVPAKGNTKITDY